LLYKNYQGTTTVFSREVRVNSKAEDFKMYI
jgi:hypothetical protein